MRIFEVDSVATTQPGSDQLLGLVEFLSGRAEDTNATKQISQQAFLNMAQQLGISVTRDNLPQLTTKPPLSNILEPLQPDSNDPIVFKGGEPSGLTMPVTKAQDIVAAAAKKAMGKDRGV